MPESVFMPYDFADSALEISVMSIELDGRCVDPRELADDRSRSVSFAGQTDWTTATIRLRITDPNEQLPNVLLEGELATDTVEILALAKSTEGRSRVAIPMHPTEPGAWAGELSIRRNQHRGSITLDAVAVRRRDGAPAERRAYRCAERLATSERWGLYLDDKPAMPGGAIDGEWKDFPTADLEELRSRTDCVWFLDLGDIERPKLYLNEAVAGLKQMLEVTQRTGRSARVRDAVAASIAQPVLLTLAITAVEESREIPFEELSGWKRRLLVSLAGQCDGRSEELQIEEWTEAWNAQNRTAVIRDLTTAIQRHIGSRPVAEQLIHALEEASDA